eukprot:Nk52_evm1s2373 gene=Nk52_evmTU1s2373
MYAALKSFDDYFQSYVEHHLYAIEWLPPLVADCLPRILFCMMALGVLDLAFFRRTKAPYFGLHVCANAFISTYCLPDMYMMFAHPFDALKHPVSSIMPSCCCIAIHLYHMLFFNDLIWLDWLHHGLMTGIVSPLSLLVPTGPLINWVLFFICGVPGGLDYLMLFLVKHGKMDKLTEKRYNSAINAWFRLPGILFCIPVGHFWIALNEPDFSQRMFCYVMGLLLFWNPIYFAERVVGNYHVTHFKRHSTGDMPEGNHLGQTNNNNNNNSAKIKNEKKEE